MTLPEYPLEQVLDVKKRRVEEAERVVDQRKKELQREEDNLKKCEKERDKVLEHKNAKLAQLREALDEGTTSEDVIAAERYLEIVKEDLVKEEEKVKAQEKVVETAKQALEKAKKELEEKRREVDKILEHKALWVKETKKEQAVQEAIQQDEIGQVMHQSRKRKKQ